jgi:hypothetical protein
MRGLALIAVLVLAGCQTTFNGGGGMPVQEPLTIGFLPTSSLPRASTGLDPGPGYSSGVVLSCTVGGYIAFRADVNANADASPVELAITRVNASGNESAVGSPAPITVVASEPPPSGLNEFIYKPMSVPEMCATLGAGDYHARIVAADGSVLAFGHFSIAP